MIRRALAMGERLDPDPATRTEWFLAAKASKWWKTSWAKFQSGLVSRLVGALSLTSDVEAFYFGSYWNRPSTGGNMASPQDAKSDHVN
jgi:hypothetical protein